MAARPASWVPLRVPSSAMATVKPRATRDCRHPAGGDCDACSWRVEWRRGGRGGSRESCTFPTRTQADSAARLAEARRHMVTDEEIYTAVLGLGDGPDLASAPKVSTAFGEWIATRRRRAVDVQADTIDEQFRQGVRYLLPFFGEMPLTPAYVHEDAVAEWVAWMRERPRRGGGTLDSDTIRRAHATLHTFLAAQVPKWLPSNPCARLPGQRQGTALPRSTPVEVVLLTPAELALIHSHCAPAIQDLVFVAPRTGLRLGELLALPVEHAAVTGRRKVLRVRQALKRNGKIGAPKSRRSRRDVTISADVAEVVARNIADKRPSDFVFTAPKGGMWNPANLTSRYWQPALAAAQRCAEHPPPLPPKPRTGPRRQWRPDEVSTCLCPGRLQRRPRFHDLRHTHVSLCAADGWEMLRVSRRIGHQSIQTTYDIYGHLWEEPDDDRLDSIERLLLIQADEAA